MFVGEVLERQLGDRLRRAPVRLVVDVLVRDRGRPHAVGFEEQHHVELVRRHLLEVDRVVHVGLAVMAAAVVLDEAGELAVGDVLRSFEHQMFEQMREAGSPLALVPRPDVIGDRDRDDRRSPIGRDDHAQAVLQPRIAEIDRGDRDGRDGGGAHGGDQDCKEAAASHDSPSNTSNSSFRFSSASFAA